MSAANGNAPAGGGMPPGAQLPPGMSPDVIFEDLPKIPGLAKAHGILMGLAFAVVFPVGSFIIRSSRTRNMIWFHAACQVVGWGMMLGGLATGIKMANILDRLHNNAHTILGTVVVAALMLQPFFGIIHHWRFKRTGGPTAWTLIHKWYGRVFMILGIVAGGSGLALAKDTPAYSKAGVIVYAVVAGISGVALLGLFTWVEVKKVRPKKAVMEGSEANGA